MGLCTSIACLCSSSVSSSCAEDGGGLLRVVPSDGPRVHGLSSTLYIGDEVWAWPANGELLEAMQTGRIKP